MCQKLSYGIDILEVNITPMGSLATVFDGTIPLFKLL